MLRINASDILRRAVRGYIEENLGYVEELITDALTDSVADDAIEDAITKAASYAIEGLTDDALLTAAVDVLGEEVEIE